MESSGKILLLNIGINTYPHISQLKCCLNDANLLHDSYSRYPCEYRKILLDSDASKNEILKSMDDLIRNSRDTDYIIFVVT